MYSEQEREQLRQELLSSARDDPRISGAAITGSAASGREDEWSDIDLAFGIRDGASMLEVVDDWTTRLHERHGVLHTLDVSVGSWLYRVFLLPSTLQIDLAFAPEGEFGARGPTFRLVLGKAADLPTAAPPDAESLIGWAWLHALHARSALARGRTWQAEYMVSGMRDRVLALACLRLGLPTADGRGMDLLPAEVTGPLADAFVARAEPDEIARAFAVTTRALLSEIQYVDPSSAHRLEPALRELAAIAA